MTIGLKLTSDFWIEVLTVVLPFYLRKYILKQQLSFGRKLFLCSKAGTNSRNYFFFSEKHLEDRITISSGFEKRITSIIQEPSPWTKQVIS